MSNKKPGTNRSGVLTEIFAFFTSVKTAITLLFLLAAGSILGTVIPQTLAPETALGMTFKARLALILEIHNIYRSWWFILLLILLALSLIACLIKRMPPIIAEWNGTGRRKQFSLKRTPTAAAKRSPALLEDVGTGLMGGAPIALGAPADGLVWVKHRVGLLGFPLLHVGIIIILLGGLLGAVYGYKGRIQITEGTTESRLTLQNGKQATLPFEIAVDKFTLQRYASGEPKEYRSDVRLLEEGKQVASGDIRVNHPLTYRRLSLYQADYKVIGVKDVTLKYTDPSGLEQDLVLEPRKRAALANGAELQLQSFDPGVTTRGAGVDVKLTEPGGASRTLSLHKGEKAVPLDVGALRYVDYNSLHTTGLQINYDPGALFVWIGSVLLIAGFSFILFLNYAWLAVRSEKGPNGDSFTITGASRKFRTDFRKSVENAFSSATK